MSAKGNVATKISLSAVLISYNAAETLTACLESLDFADEILLLDSFSKDQTLAIAAQFGCRVIEQEWLGFGRQKQLAVELAKHDWVLCIDCDEIVSPKLAEEIIKAINHPQAAGYYLPRCNRFLGKYLRHGEGYPDYCLRLFDRRSGNWSDDAVHEKVIINGNCLKFSADLLHDSAYLLSQYLLKQNRYSDLAATKEINQGKSASIKHLIASPLFRFFKFYILRQGWRDGWQGLVHIVIGCFTSFCKYAKMLEQQNNSKKQIK